MSKKAWRLTLVMSALMGAVAVSGFYSQSQPPLQAQLIRFHVIAHSDNDADQALKLALKDYLLASFAPELFSLTTPAEMEHWLAANRERIEKVAQERVYALGSEDPVRVELGDFDFPTKAYGDLVLPAGRYRALQVIIGAGEGKNWWCVLFPPLCFVDASTGVAKQVQSPALEPPPTGKVEVRFKILDVLSGEAKLVEMAGSRR